MLTRVSQRATLQECFEYRGKWWLPECPSTTVPGTIGYTPTEGVTLTLDGDFKRYPDVVLGVCGGLDFTALNLAEHQHSFGRGVIHSTSLRVEVLIAGAHFPSKAEVLLPSMAAGLTELPAWHGGYPFLPIKPPNGGRYDFSFELPKPTETRIPSLDSHLRIEHRLPFSAGEEFHCQHATVATFTPDTPQSVWWYLRTAFHLQALLTVLIGQPVYATDFFSRSDKHAREGGANGELREPFHVYFHPSFTPDAGTEGVLAFRFKEVEPQFSAMLEGWFSTYEHYHPVYSALLQTFYHPGRYADAQLLSLAQALEGFHIRKYKGKFVDDLAYETYLVEMKAHLPEGMPQRLKQAITTRLGYGNEYSLRARLREIMRKLDPTVMQLIHRNPDALADAIVETRNRLVHPREAPSSRTADAEVVSLMLHAKALLTIAVLDAIGTATSALRNAVTLRRI